jgi:hypothetical protein
MNNDKASLLGTPGLGGMGPRGPGDRMLGPRGFPPPLIPRKTILINCVYCQKVLFLNPVDYLYRWA